MLLRTVVACSLAFGLWQGAGVHPISGREYARPISVAGAPWLDRDQREREEAPSQALAIMQVTPGSVVADIGAGSGYFTTRLSRLVGPRGKVFANDIQQGMLDLLRERVQRERLANVTLVLGEPTDPKLPSGAIDLALMVDVYHELADPQTMLARIRTALKPTGRLVLIEYKGEDPSIPILPLHKMTVAQAKMEVEPEGFQLATVNSNLPRQHVLIFTVGEIHKVRGSAPAVHGQFNADILARMIETGVPCASGGGARPRESCDFVQPESERTRPCACASRR